MWIAAALAAHGAELTALTVEVGRPNHGRVAGVVRRPLAQVLARVMDCDGADRWFPDVRDTEVIFDDGEVVRCAGRTDLPWPIADRTWQLDTSVERVDARTVRVPFVLVPGVGNVTALHGSYLLEDLGGGRTAVTYEAWVDLGLRVPDVLVDWATRRVLPEILVGLEGLPPPERVEAEEAPVARR